MGSCISSSPGPTGAQGTPGVDGVGQAQQETVQRELAGGAVEGSANFVDYVDGRAECGACHTPFKQGDYDGEKCYVAALGFNEYQSMAHSLAIYDQSFGPVYAIIGLAGEVGELANKWKKVMRDTGGVLTDEMRAALKKELGDVFWYAAETATVLGYTMEDVAQSNLNNLFGRKERGTLPGSGDNR